MFLGAMQLARRFTWDGMADFYAAPRVPLEGPEGYMEMFVSAHDKMKYYWMLNGGHAVSSYY